MAEIVLTKENFKSEVLESEKTVLVDFWAVWCGPCKMISPIIEQIANTHDNIKVGKINVDEQPDLAAEYGVASIPTLLIFKDGKVVEQSVGYQPLEAVEALIAKY